MNKKTLLIALATVVGGAAQADVVIMDQITGNTFQLGAASQDFETVNDAFDIAVADNFTTVVGGNNLTKVTAFLGLYGGTATVRNFNNITAYRVEIYSSTAAAGASLTGDAGSMTVAAGSASRNDLSATASLVTIPVSIALMENTNYLISVIPVMNFGGGFGQSAVWTTNNGTGTPGDKNAIQANPGGGFGFGPTQTIVSSGLNVDAGYQIEAVPEPGTIAALGMGALVLLRRRKK
ncbi:MAG TPA: PEP-CTERM sorting domain-containing protein [Fimbriimonadaceae bacterium]|nr:PEP-CTERM sorting domain-containing protein [Fimbriimonadaceae bacterium]